MDSIARNQFPQVVWREGEKLLWNPIHRKALKNRPEERVRLRTIEYLLQAGWSKHRISTEESVSGQSEGELRTDIICYNQKFEPRILVECKAENIPISNKTGQQIARYNQNVQAPWLLMTNGLQDFWYRIDIENKDVTPMASPPDLMGEARASSAGNDFEYWNNRGFAGEKAKPALRKWLNPLLASFPSNKEGTGVRYLQFKNSPTDLNISHYYRITSFEDGKTALSFLATPFGGTRLLAILNRNGENRAVAEINLDLLFEGEKPNTSTYSREGVQNFDIAQHAEAFSDLSSETDIKDITHSIHRFFTDRFGK